MERALDDWTGEVVRARQVKEMHVYRCLCCGEDVLYARAARPQDARFRHRHDNDQPCVQFEMPGGRFDRAWQGAAARRLHPALTAAPRRSGARLTWRVELFLPGFQEEFDSFEIIHDVHSGWHVPAELPPEGARFEVVPVEGGFSAEALRKGRPVETCPYEGAVGVLSRRSANVFDLGAGGRQLEVDTSLVPDRDYLVLTPAFKALPPHPQASLRELAAPNPNPPYSLWRGYLLRFLSDEEDAAAWCGQHLLRPLEPPPLRLDIVYPPVLKELANGVLVLPQGERVLLALRGTPGLHVPPAVLVRRDQSQTISGVCLRPAPELPVYVELGALAPGDYTALAPSASALALSLRIAPAEVPEVQAVELTVLDGAGQPRTLPLHDPAAADALADAVAGGARVEEIHLPDGVSLKIQWRRVPDGDWETWTVPAGRRWADALADCLSAGPAGVRLDAGAFGRAEWRAAAASGVASAPRAFTSGVASAPRAFTSGVASAPREEDGDLHGALTRPRSPKTGVRRLPESLRGRIQWLFQARLLYHGHSPGGALGIALPTVAGERLGAADRRLVTQLRETVSWPAALLPQARAAGRDLTRLLQNDR